MRLCLFLSLYYFSFLVRDKQKSKEEREKKKSFSIKLSLLFLPPLLVSPFSITFSRLSLPLSGDRRDGGLLRGGGLGGLGGGLALERVHRAVRGLLARHEPIFF